MSYPFIIKAHEGLNIVRDDLLPGGTKQRGLSCLLKTIKAYEIAYPGTVLGYGALALAEACRENGKKAVIFISDDQKGRTDILKKLVRTQAVLKIPSKPTPLESLKEQAINYQQHDPDHSLYMPPGFKTDDFKSAMRKELKTFPEQPKEIWVSAVSGTMAQILEEAFPKAALHVVAVAKNHDYSGRGRIYNAPEKYHQLAKNPPPYPSFPYCDAKLWPFAKEYASPGAYIWNMGA